MGEIQDRARGRWHDILRAIGVDQSYLNGKHGPCPFCADPGKDRWRYDDKGGDGTFICSVCGAGNGVGFVMKFLKVDFLAAKDEIAKHLGEAKVRAPRASRTLDSGALVREWRNARPISTSSPVGRYLRSRGVWLANAPTQLRYAPNAVCHHKGGSFTEHPAMLAKFASADAKSFTIHRTFLTDAGTKADIPGLDGSRKIAAGLIPIGGAVRLAPSAETMGIAEGIETALSAMIMFGLPVWACLNSGLMLKWEPPPNVKHVIVFGDNDKAFGGQASAYGAAYRLTCQRGLEVEVRIPDSIGEDFNDVLVSEQRDGRFAQAEIVESEAVEFA